MIAESSISGDMETYTSSVEVGKATDNNMWINTSFRKLISLVNTEIYFDLILEFGTLS